MTTTRDRVYELLPAVYRLRDAEQGGPLQGLLRVVGEQAQLVEEAITQLYEDWFIETCEDWVVPYLGDLVGCRLVLPAITPAGKGQPPPKVLVPRRDVANTIRYRRRKGALALLELVAADAAGWPARALEGYRRLSFAQPLNHLHPNRGRTVDLRQGGALARLGGPFDPMARTVDVRRPDSHRATGHASLPAVALFIWRLQAFSVTGAPAYCHEEVGPHCFSFSALGQDAPLFTGPRPQDDATAVAGELQVPAAIGRVALEDNLRQYYGPGRSIEVWEDRGRAVARDRVVVADLSAWHYRPRRGQVALDPVLGRLAFPPGQAPKEGVRVSYRYGFSAWIGGGEYRREVSHPTGATVYPVGRNAGLTRIRDAYRRFRDEAPTYGVIEIGDSDVYVEQLRLDLAAGQTLQIRAASGARPLLRLLDWQTDRPDALTVSGADGSSLTLDGLLVAGRGVEARGALADLRLRHCTLVPGWGLYGDCQPWRPNEPSLYLATMAVRVAIDRSIVGSIVVSHDEVNQDPLTLDVRDSVLDATRPMLDALAAPDGRIAHALATVARCTVIGAFRTHAIERADDTIFTGAVHVARRAQGCMRFCSVPPGSRTPRRYQCQPDLVEHAVREAVLGPDDQARALAIERQRVRPVFVSTRYGSPAYCQLAETCAEEIRQGAGDESEMGVFHHLHEPHRRAVLQTRIDEYTPAGMETGIIYAS